MKKILFSLFALVLCISLVGCEKEEKNEEKNEKNNYDYLILVNKQNKLPEDWKEKVELVKTKNAWDEDIEVEKKAFEIKYVAIQLT